MNQKLSKVVTDLIPERKKLHHRVIESLLSRTPISRKVYSRFIDDRKFKNLREARFL
jgi:hypothetical protein